MATMSFEEYCEDIADVQIALLSDDQRANVFANYQAFTAPARTVKVEKHHDAQLKAVDVRAKLQRLVNDQKFAVVKYSALNVEFAKSFIARAEATLAGKATKAELLELITINSEVSRDLNSQKQGR
jgi:hypothetical protein